MNYLDNICHLFPFDMLANQSINSSDETALQFTKCEEQILFTWFPCSIFVVLAPFWMYVLHKKDSENLKMSFDFVAKNIFIILLLLNQLAHLAVLFAQFRAAQFRIHLIGSQFLFVTFVIEIQTKN